MKIRLIFSLTVISFIMLSSAGLCNSPGHLVETTPSGSINWTLYRVQATGTGAPDKKCGNDPQIRKETMEKARSSGISKLLETIKYIRRQTDQSIGDHGRSKTEFMEKIAEMVKKASVAKQEFLSDGSINIVVSMNLNGGFAQYVLPEEIRQVESVKTIAGNPETMKSKKDERSGLADKLKYTGLIVDADQIAVKPVMMPVILDENKRQVYGPEFASREYAVQYGMTGYATTVDAALSDKRAGNNPLVVKGLKAEGPGNANVVISNADASRLKGASANLSFLKQCRVVIVIH